MNLDAIQQAFEDAVNRQQFEYMKVDLTKDPFHKEYVRLETASAFMYFMAGLNYGTKPNFGDCNEIRHYRSRMLA